MASSVLPLVLLWTFVQFHSTLADEHQPFFHDFGTGLHGWKLGSVWRWSGNDGFPINIRHNRSLSRDGNNTNYLWTQKTITELNDTNFGLNTVHYESVFNVTRQTRFNVTYWLQSSDGNCAFLDVVLSNTSNGRVFFHTKHIGDSTGGWTDYTVDCNRDRCCDQYDCDLRIMIVAAVWCSHSTGLLAIRSVSATGIGQQVGSASSSIDTVFIVTSVCVTVVLMLSCIAFVIMRSRRI